mgnify:CR=1 FL=1
MPSGRLVEGGTAGERRPVSPPSSALVADMAHCWREARLRVYGTQQPRPLQPQSLRNAANRWHALHHPPEPPPQTPLKLALAAAAASPDYHAQQLTEVREGAARDTRVLQQEVLRLHAVLADNSRSRAGSASGSAQTPPPVPVSYTHLTLPTTAIV